MINKTKEKDIPRLLQDLKNFSDWATNTKVTIDKLENQPNSIVWLWEGETDYLRIDLSHSASGVNIDIHRETRIYMDKLKDMYKTQLEIYLLEIKKISAGWLALVAAISGNIIGNPNHD